ncbi:MAG: hypothetical protein HY291_02030 [Planctomycetes bacterium]|nr:hypothetical protein [Planctomycetota bacterium]
MPIIVFCKDCGKKIRVPEGPPGRFGKCPQCQARVAIPAEDETAPPSPEKLKKALAVGAAAGEAKAAKQSAGASLPEDAATPPEALAPVAAPLPAPKRKTESAEPEVPKADPPKQPESSAAEKPEPAAPEREQPQPAAPAAGPTAPAKAVPPKPRAPTGKAPRIALDLKQIEAAASATKGEKASNHAKAKGSAVEEQFGSVKWDTRPDVPPSRAPYFLAAAAVVLGVLGYGAWYFFMRTEAKRLSPEERKKLQYEAPEEDDPVKHLRDETPGAAKSSAKPEAPKSEPAQSEKSKSAAPESKPGSAPDAADPKEAPGKT